MSKVVAHLRVAKQAGNARFPYRVDASQRPNHMPLVSSSGSALPTLAFAVMLDIPDSAFKQAENVIAEIMIPEDALQIVAEVKQ